MTHRRPFDLRSLFRIGGWLMDEDGDGLPDNTRVTVVLRDGITHEEVLAAAELAARIGHETLGLTPPIAVGESRLSEAHPHRVFLVVDAGHVGNPSIALRPDTDVEVAATTASELAAALRFLARRFPDSERARAMFSTLDRVGAESDLVALTLTPDGFDVASARVEATRSVVGAASSAETEGIRIDVVSFVGHALGTIVAPLAQHEPGAQSPIAGVDPSRGATPEPEALLDLARPYRAGGFLQAADGGAARADVQLALSPDAAEGDFVALVGVAARLGLETPALQLPFDGRRAIRFGGRTHASEIVVRQEDGHDVIDVNGTAAGGWLAFGASGSMPDLAGDVERAVESRNEQVVGRPRRNSHIAWEDSVSLPWEVDELRECLRDDVLPRLSTQEPVSIVVTTSEPAEVREELRELVSRSLHERGMTGSVVLRPAYKQGLHWLLDEVAPAVAADPSADSVRVACRAFGASIAAPWLSPMVLKELRLVDEEAAAAMEQQLRRTDGSPAWLDPPLRWLLELYPVDELLAAASVDVRFDVVETQPEAYRAEILDRNGHIVATHVFDPLWTEQPFLSMFPHVGLAHPPTGGIRAEQGDLVIERRVATDPERIWQHFQQVVLPAVAAELRAHHAGVWPNAREPLFAALELDVTVSEPDETLGIDEERLSPLEALHEDLHFGALEFFSAWGEAERGRPLLSPGQIVPRIHYRTGHGAHVAVRLIVHDDADAPSHPVREEARVTRVRVNAVGDPVELDVVEAGETATVAVATAAEAVRRDGVPTDRALAPAEVEVLARGLSTHRDVAAFAVGETATGRRLVAISAVLRGEAAVFSAAKAIAWKPTLLVNAGHHGNEPSSTNAVLRLVELLTSDDRHRARLLRANVVALALENADGAALAQDLAREHPAWMLHAGRFNSLGFEFRAAYGDSAHPSTESRALPTLWREARPEIYVDAHGCPSHEWVQPFTGYAPVWPAYWAPRAQLMAYVRYPDGEPYNEHRHLAVRLVELVDEVTNARPETVAHNQRFADRYARYASRWMPETFPLAQSASGSVIYLSPATPGSDDWANWSTDFMTVHPEITSLSMITEIPDETVGGPTMGHCVDTQLAAFEAALDLLAEWDGKLERHVAIVGDASVRQVRRPRPLRRASPQHDTGDAEPELEEVSS